MYQGPFKKTSRRDPRAPLAPRAAWAVPLEKFVGGGCMVSRTFAVDGRAEEDYDCVWGADYAARPIWVSDDGYSVHAALDYEPHTVVLVKDGAIVGFDQGGQLWIDQGHRGRGLGAELVLALAEALDRGPYDCFGLLGYSASGMAAHEAAWRRAVRRRIEAGLPIPEAVAAEFEENAPSPP